MIMSELWRITWISQQVSDFEDSQLVRPLHKTSETSTTTFQKLMSILNIMMFISCYIFLPERSDISNTCIMSLLHIHTSTRFLVRVEHITTIFRLIPGLSAGTPWHILPLFVIILHATDGSFITLWIVVIAVVAKPGFTWSWSWNGKILCSSRDSFSPLHL